MLTTLPASGDLCPPLPGHGKLSRTKRSKTWSCICFASNYQRTWVSHLPGSLSAAVMQALFTQVMIVYGQVDNTAVSPVYRLRDQQHGVVWDVLELDRSWYEAPTIRQNTRLSIIPP